MVCSSLTWSRDVVLIISTTCEEKNTNFTTKPLLKIQKKNQIDNKRIVIKFSVFNPHLINLLSHFFCTNICIILDHLANLGGKINAKIRQQKIKISHLFYPTLSWYISIFSKFFSFMKIVVLTTASISHPWSTKDLLTKLIIWKKYIKKIIFSFIYTPNKKDLLLFDP